MRAVKQANDRPRRRRGTSSRTGLDLYAGDDDLLLPFLELGGVGGICVAHARRRPAGAGADRALADAASTTRARALDRELAPLDRALARRRQPDRDQGRADLLGHEVGGHRLPLVDATDDERAAVRDCLERLGLLEPAAV